MFSLRYVCDSMLPLSTSAYFYAFLGKKKLFLNYCQSLVILSSQIQNRNSPWTSKTFSKREYHKENIDNFTSHFPHTIYNIHTYS